MLRIETSSTAGAALVTERVTENAGDLTASAATAKGVNAPLTARQVEIVRLVAEGRSNKEIAAHLFLSIDAVKHHVMRACRRWNVSNRTALAAVWLRPQGDREDQ
jgi:DNA-binding NarL/FixJ family response regulator